MPVDLCDEIVHLCSGRNRLKLHGEQKSTYRNYLSANLLDLSTECDQRYKTLLSSFVDLYLQEHEFLGELAQHQPLILDYDNVRVQWYDKNCYYKMLHCENDHTSRTHHRILVYMTYCNDIDEGGGTSFPYQNLITKPEKGLTLIWPAYWTHPHVGIPSPTSSKIITTGWFTNTSAEKLKSNDKLEW